MARVPFIDALNGTLTDEEALSGDLPANLREASGFNDEIGEATAAALALKAPLASPAFTGTPTVPTASQGTNTTQAASTAFVVAEIAASATDLAGSIHDATGKTTPADADEFALVDSAASNVLKKLTWANLKATLLAVFGSNGIVARTAAGTFAARTVTGTAGQITVTNGDGVSGDPTISLPADVLVPTVMTFPNTGLHILDTNASHDLIIAPGSNITADRTLTITTGDANRTLDISGGSVTITAAAATVLDDSTVAAMATTLGLGTASNPQFATIELGAASDTTISRTAAGTIAVEGLAVAMAGKQMMPIPAGAMKATTTNGAASGTAEMTTNKNMFVTLDFDTSTQEFAQFSIPMPKSWNESTVTFQAVWSHASTTTNFGVVWQLAGVAVSDDDAGDVAFGTAQTSTDTGGTTNDIYISPESSAITIAGTPAENDMVMFQVARVPANGSDTMAIDARLHAIKLYITTNAGNDA